VNFFGADVRLLENYSLRELRPVSPVDPEMCTIEERRKMQDVLLTVWHEVATQPSTLKISTAALTVWEYAASIPSALYSTTYRLAYHALWEPITPTGLIFSLYRLGLEAE